MSGPTIEQEKFPPDSTDVDDFERFMKAKGIPDTCVICHGPISITQTTHGGIPYVLTGNYPPSMSQLWVSYAFRTRCQNCGNLQDYDRDAVGKWKNENT